ncbi:MAG: phenylalanine--tRNA ligase subunit alpha, partial [Paracoccaceae bacterium]
MTNLRGKYVEAVASAATEAALEEVRLAALGKKGEISALMSTLGKMDPDQRKAAGAAMNSLRDEIDAALRARKAGLADAALDARLRSEWLDVTL